MSIQIYTTPTCHWCHKTKEYFAARNVKFTEHDVSMDESKAQEMIEKSGQLGVPVLDIDGQIIIGFNKPAIDAAIEKSTSK